MTERGWITIAVRGIGLWWTVSGSASLLGQVASLIASYGQMNTFGVVEPWFWPTIVYAVVPLGIGLYLLLGGQYFIDRFAREIVDRCRRCGYDVGSELSGCCPECGALLRPCCDEQVPSRPAGAPATTDTPAGSG